MSDQYDTNDFTTNEWKDFVDNFDHFEASVRLFHGGNTSAFKWMTLTLFMSLQSLFVICLQNTDFHRVTRNRAKVQLFRKSKIQWVPRFLSRLLQRQKRIYIFELCSNWDADKVVVDHKKRLLQVSTAAHDRANQLAAINEEFSPPLSKDDFARAFQKCWELVDFWELYKRVKSTGRMEQYIDSKPLPPEPKFDEAIEMIVRIRNEFIHFVPKHWTISSGHIQKMILPCIEILRFLLAESNNVRPDDPRDIVTKLDAILPLLQTTHVHNPPSQTLPDSSRTAAAPAQ